MFLACKFDFSEFLQIFKFLAVITNVNYLFCQFLATILSVQATNKLLLDKTKSQVFIYESTRLNVLTSLTF